MLFTYLIIAFVLILVGVPSFIGFFLWIKSYNKRALIIEEKGENPDLANIKLYNIKNTSLSRLGKITRFFFAPNLKYTKQFNSSFWTTIKHKKKLFDGTIIYMQGENFRPCRLKRKDDGKVILEIQDEDNREFLMDKIIRRREIGEESKVLITAIITFAIAMFLIFLVTMVSMWVITKTNWEQYALRAIGM